MQQSTIAELFQAMGYDWQTMEIGKPYNVESRGFQILGVDESNGIGPQVWRNIKKIVRKPDAPSYKLELWLPEATEPTVVVCAADHLFPLKSQKFDEVWIDGEHIKSNSNIKEATAQQLYDWQESDPGFLKKYCLITPSAYGNDGFHWSGGKCFLFTPVGPHPVLDIEVEYPHLYYTNGILSHNTMFGSPETTSGGNALKFYASVRLDIRRIGTIKQGEDKTGNQVRVKVVKCKVAPPFRQAEFNIMFGEGIDAADDLLNAAVRHGHVKKSGAWFAYGDKPLGQGNAKAAATIRDTEGLADELRSLVLGIKKEEKEKDNG